MYPYHQSIGFYLKRAGYPESDQLLPKHAPLELDFLSEPQPQRDGLRSGAARVFPQEPKMTRGALCHARPLVGSYASPEHEGWHREG